MIANTPTRRHAAARHAAAWAAATTVAAASLLAPGQAGAATPLHCTASASPSNPQQYTTVNIFVNGNRAGARVRTIAHYKTTATPHYATANKYGNANVPYQISGASKGYTVKVGATISVGTSSYTCQTSFTPR